MKYRLVTILIVLLLSQNAAADFNDGVVALMSGDHD